ncbi:MAG: hypothetical protein AABZ23_04445 [Deltaproteobacteria bacterium]
MIVLLCPQDSPATTGDKISISYVLDIPATEAHEAPWGRDIFVPLSAGGKAVAPGLKITAIFFSRTRPSAIINNSIVYVGSSLNGQKVVDIGEGHVILEDAKGQMRLEIPREFGTGKK